MPPLAVGAKNKILIDWAKMPRKSSRSATETYTAGAIKNGVGDELADAPVVAAAEESTSAVGSVVDLVRREIERLVELQELLQFAEVDLAERNDRYEQLQARELAFRSRHAKRILRFRRLRSAFRQLERQEQAEVNAKQKEVLVLQQQLAEAASMLESARDASHLSEDEHRTELERLRDLIDDAEQRAREAEEERLEVAARVQHLTGELDEACEQIIRLESELERNGKEPRSDTSALLRLEKDLDELKTENETLREQCQDLLEEKASLASELADLKVARLATAPAPMPMESMTWEQRKAAILEQLRREEMGETVSGREAQSIRQMLDKTEAEITRRDEEIAELRELLEQQSATIHSTSCGDEVAIGAAGIAMLFDSDLLIQEERDRLKGVQAELEEKLRQAEIELSLERAKLARGRRELEQKQADLEHRLSQLEKDVAADAKAEDGKPPRRRWLKQLGLGDGG